MTYREQEAAVLLQSTKEANERNTGDDDAADQQHVGHTEVGQAGSEGSHP